VSQLIEISFCDTDTFIAELLEDAAPRTCEAVWKALPLETSEARHPMFSGLGMYMVVDFRLDVVENPHVFGGDPGDVFFHADPNNAWVIDHPHSCEIYVPYGPLRVSDWAGDTPLNKFARYVSGDRSRFPALGRRFREEGFQRMTIRAHDG
jgi:hypothetical protein